MSILMICFLKHDTMLPLLDDDTPYTFSSNMQTALSNLQEAIVNSFNGFLRIILWQIRINVTY